MEYEVAITGIGMLSPLGLGTAEHGEALIGGVCGLTGKKGQSFPPFLGTIPTFTVQDYIKKIKAVRVMAKRTVFACATASMALREAGFPEESQDAGENGSGVIFGAAVCEGSILSIADALLPCVTVGGQIDYHMLGDIGYRRLSPLWIVQRLPNTTAGQLSILYGIKGLNLSIVNGPVSGMVSIGEAFVSVKHGRAGWVLCGGAEDRVPADLYFRLRTRGIASETDQGSQPFNEKSDGLHFSEGSAALIAENVLDAKERGARIYGKILAYRNAYLPRLANAEPREKAEFYAQTISAVLNDARLTANDIDFVQASASGLAQFDEAEALAIRQVFKLKPFITSAHGAIGHTLAATGPLAVACALVQLNKNFLAPIMRTQKLFFDDELNYVTGRAVSRRNKYCLVNCFDYMGGVSSIIIENEEAVA